MSNFKAIRELLRRTSGQDNVFTVPRIYVEYTGDLTTAVLLNQIVFYSDKSKRTDGFFYKTYTDWEKEICLTKRQVRYSTEKLKDLGILETKIKKANGAPTVHYKLHYEKFVDSIVTKCHIPLEQNVTNESDNMSQSLTENTTENTTLKDSRRKRVYDKDSLEYKIALFFYQEILKNNAKHKEPNLQNWSNDIRLLLEIDNRDKTEVGRVIQWVQKDSFWMTNILSPKKLREKYDALVFKMNQEKANGTKDKPAPKSSEVQEFELDITRGE